MQYYRITAPVRHNPRTPMQALILADAYLRMIGFVEVPQLSPLAIVQGTANEVTANLNPFITKVKSADLLPGLRLKSGSSVIEITRVFPTNKEVIYKNSRGKAFRVSSEKFIQLANQQGYKKIWDMTTFLSTLKDLLKPVLGAVPLMWVMKLILNSLRRKPVSFMPHSSGAKDL